MIKIPSNKVIVGVKWNNHGEISADSNSDKEVDIVFTITLAYFITALIANPLNAVTNTIMNTMWSIPWNMEPTGVPLRANSKKFATTPKIYNFMF